MEIRRYTAGSQTAIQFRMTPNSSWRTFTRGKIELYTNDTTEDVQFKTPEFSNLILFQNPIPVSSVLDFDNGNTPFTITSLTDLFVSERFFEAAPNGNGGGGSSPLIPEDQRVDTYADLPDAVANDGKYYIVDTKTGVYLLGTRREAGIYKSVGGSWVYRGADVPYYLQDDQFTINDSTDTTKRLGFEVDQISSGQRRIATWQDKDGTVAYLSDLVFVSATPPTDLTRRWKNTNDNLIYFYETDSGGLNGSWVSEQLYRLDLNENANTGNGTFLRFGNTALDQIEAGVPFLDNIRVYYADYTNKNLSLGQFIVYVALAGQAGAAIGSFVTDTVNYFNRVQFDIGGVLQEFSDLPANRRISVQWSGAANNDTILIIYYRKRYV